VRENGSCRRWSPRLPLVASAVLLLVCPGLARAAQSLSAAQRLANEYAPITMVRLEDDPPCDTTEEQYQPTSVDTVLGNPTVTLDRAVPGRHATQVVRRAPTARDIAGLGSDYYLNLKGSPLGDTCVYARSFAALKRAGEAPVVTYAHIARERGYSGFALQFFFFWYFNQFNDLHESDWEGMQLTFDAASPRAALGEEPDRMILFQHAGGERADWDDEKVQTDGRHPVVHPAAGSHATFYSSAVYVENGEHGSGLGCDKLRATGARAAPAPDPAARPGHADGPVCVAQLHRSLGPEGGGVQHRPDRPRDQEGVDAAVFVDGRAAPLERADAGRLGRRARDNRGLLRSRGQRVGAAQRAAAVIARDAPHAGGPHGRADVAQRERYADIRHLCCDDERRLKPALVDPQPPHVGPHRPHHQDVDRHDRLRDACACSPAGALQQLPRLATRRARAFGR
jgi:hypothetical protein